MALKYFILAFVALFVLQGATEAKPSLDIETTKLDAFRDLINKILQLIRDAVTTTTAQLKKVIDQVLASGKVIVDKAHSTVKDLVTSLVGEINKLVGEAEDLGVDVTECLGKNLEGLENVPFKILNELNACLETEIQKAYTILDDTIKLIDDILYEVVGLEEEYFACHGGIICMTKVIGKATVMLTKLPVRIVDITAKAVKTITALAANITVCTTATVTEAVGDATDAAQGITKCILEKIDEVVTTIVSA